MQTYLGMNKEHWVQFAFQIATFMLTIIGAVWFLAWLIAGIQATDAAGRALLSERISILEEDRKEDSAVIARLSSQLDNERDIINNQNQALTKLTDALDVLNKRR